MAFPQNLHKPANARVCPVTEQSLPECRGAAVRLRVSGPGARQLIDPYERVRAPRKGGLPAVTSLCQAPNAQKTYIIGDRRRHERACDCHLSTAVSWESAGRQLIALLCTPRDFTGSGTREARTAQGGTTNGDEDS